MDQCDQWDEYNRDSSHPKDTYPFTAVFNDPMLSSTNMHVVHINDNNRNRSRNSGNNRHQAPVLNPAGNPSLSSFSNPPLGHMPNLNSMPNGYRSANLGQSSSVSHIHTQTPVLSSSSDSPNPNAAADKPPYDPTNYYDLLLLPQPEIASVSPNDIHSAYQHVLTSRRYSPTISEFATIQNAFTTLTSWFLKSCYDKWLATPIGDLYHCPDGTMRRKEEGESGERGVRVLMARCKEQIGELEEKLGVMKKRRIEMVMKKDAGKSEAEEWIEIWMGWEEKGEDESAEEKEIERLEGEAVRRREMVGWLEKEIDREEKGAREPVRSGNGFGILVWRMISSLTEVGGRTDGTREAEGRARTKSEPPN